jgi:hypothetical protein
MNRLATQIFSPHRLAALIFSVFIFSIFSCGPARVQRVNPDEVIDLSGRWNDTDSRITAEKMVRDLEAHSWYNTYSANNGGEKPTIIVGLIANKSHEHIASETFCNDVEIAIINNNRMGLVQAGNKREEIRAERADQQNYASQSTMKQFGLENGADFMLQGDINSIVDEYGGESAIYYDVTMELTNIQTNDVVWKTKKRIKKLINGRRKR